MGFFILLGLGLFFILMLLAGWLAYGWASRRSWAKKWYWLMGVLGAFAVWNTVFYETIPTNIAVRYLCATEGGPRVYGTAGMKGKTFYFNDTRGRWLADGWYRTKEMTTLLSKIYLLNKENSADYELRWTYAKESDLIDKYQMQIIQTNPKKILGTWTAFSAEPHGGNGSDYFRGAQTLFISGGCLPTRQEDKLFNFTQQVLKPSQTGE